MKTWEHRYLRRGLLIPIVIVMVLLFSTVVAASGFFTATSNVTGTITVTSGGGSPAYSATASNLVFTTTQGAGAVNLIATINVTDTSTGGGVMTSITGISLGSGTLPSGLSIAPADGVVFPIDFVSGQASVDVKLTGSLAAGTYNLSTGSPVVYVQCSHP